MKVNTETCHVH